MSNSAKSFFINVKINESLTLPTETYADLIPGEIIMFPVSSVPSSVSTTILDSEYFLECNGDSFSESNYPLLYDAISTRFGSGTGTDTFNVPNLNSSSEDAAIMIRGDGNMDTKSTIETDATFNANNKINHLPEHNTDHSYTINSVNVYDFGFNEVSVALNDNTQTYPSGLTSVISKKSTAGYGNKNRGFAKNDHTHSITYGSKGYIMETNELLNTNSTINYDQINVSNNIENQSNYVFPSIKLKYYIFTGVRDGDNSDNSAYVDTESSNYDTNNNATSSFQNVTIKDSFTVSSNQVISKPNKIIIYPGKTPPEGYVWCDGNNNTPDLKDRFITSTISSDSVGKYKNNNNTKSNEIESFPGHSHTVTISDDNITSHEINYKTNVSYEYGTLNGMEKSGVSNNADYKGNANHPGDHFHTFNYSYIKSSQIAFNYGYNETMLNPIDIINDDDDETSKGVKSNITNNNISQSETNDNNEFIPAYVSIGFIMKSTS